MAIQCAASARIALPTTLRSIFLSDLHYELPSPARRLSCFTSTPKYTRPFSSTNRFFELQANHLDGVTTASTSSPIKAPSEQKVNHVKSHASSQKTPSTLPTKPAKKSNDRSKSKANKERKDANKDKKADQTQKFPKRQKNREHWQLQKEALREKFPEGWNPPKKLSPDALDGIRHLHASNPERFTTEVLAAEFKVSPEAIRRILKSRWKPNETEMESRRQRWERRHERIWSQMAELGLRKPSEGSRALRDSNLLYSKDAN